MPGLRQLQPPKIQNEFKKTSEEQENGTLLPNICAGKAGKGELL
ncbi:MAG: hypothetical protein ABFD08_20325 [Syntrophomonas sp.]